jgi:hypothetical protein
LLDGWAERERDERVASSRTGRLPEVDI